MRHQIILENGQVCEKKCMRTKRWEAISWFTLLGKSYFFTNLKKNTWKAGQLLVLNELLRWCLTCYVTLWPEYSPLPRQGWWEDQRASELQRKGFDLLWGSWRYSTSKCLKNLGFLSWLDVCWKKYEKIALSHVFKQQKLLKNPSCQKLARQIREQCQIQRSKPCKLKILENVSLLNIYGSRHGWLIKNLAAYNPSQTLLVKHATGHWSTSIMP